MFQQLIFFLFCSRDTDNSNDLPEQKPSSQRNNRTKTNEKRAHRQHSLRLCRVVEPTYKTVRPLTKRTQSRLSFNASPMITCANISLQRKFYKQVLVAESDGKNKFSSLNSLMNSEI